MRLIDGDKVIDTGDRVIVKDEAITGIVEDFAVKIRADNNNRSFAAIVESVELLSSASELIVNWPREKEIRDYARDHQLSLTAAIQSLTNAGLSHL